MNKSSLLSMLTPTCKEFRRVSSVNPNLGAFTTVLEEENTEQTEK